MKLFITGAAGFIGSAVVRQALLCNHQVLAFDKLTYAGNRASLKEVEGQRGFEFLRGDIRDRKSLARVFQDYRPDVVLHLAAESHVDRSIDGPSDFIQTNIHGTYQLLEATRAYLNQASDRVRQTFRFLHVSTDEVYGDLEGSEALFSEETPYDPSSPYSASKAASDHLVRAWGRTYGVPFLVTNCSNNYGPRQFPEKLIPHMILSALSGNTLPVYGNGKQIRDWLYVEDHASALLAVMEKGGVGETYNIGGHNEKSNLEVVQCICQLVEELFPSNENASVDGSYKSLIAFVKDRPGHDVRYAIDASKIERALGWKPLETFDTGLRKTVEWYLASKDWWKAILDGSYRMERLA